MPKITPQTRKKVKGLNKIQKIAVYNALRKEMTLIWGPPGTGKTYTLSIIMAILAEIGFKKLEEEKLREMIYNVSTFRSTETESDILFNLNQKYGVELDRFYNSRYQGGQSVIKKVIVTGESNAAVDNICFQLIEMGVNVKRILSRRSLNDPELDPRIEAISHNISEQEITRLRKIYNKYKKVWSYFYGRTHRTSTKDKEIENLLKCEGEGDGHWEGNNQTNDIGGENSRYMREDVPLRWKTANFTYFNSDRLDNFTEGEMELRNETIVHKIISKFKTFRPSVETRE